MSENKEKKSLERKIEEIKVKLKRADKSKLFGKILAAILAILMVLSIAATCIYAIINIMG